MELNVLTIIEKGGFLAVSAFLLYLVKKQSDRIDKSEKEQKEEQKEISAKVDGIFKDYVPKEDHKALQEKVYSIETEYVPKADFYRDVSGWRGDIQRILEKVDTLTKELAYFRGACGGCNHKERLDG